jgi:DNA-binding transcriptional regulator YiaG
MNITTLLKSEMARLARKELKAEVEPLRKALTAHRSAMAKMKREIAALAREVKGLRKHAGRPDTAARPPRDGDDAGHRFSAKGLASHRKKLGFSREQYATLVGVSAQSIYKWERGEARPRQAQLAALVQARGLGKRQAVARLEASAD